MADFPTFEAELGYAVARGWTNLTMADAAILARTTDDAEAKRMAIAVRRSAAAWHHIREQLALRISELTAANAKAQLPKNAILAQAHTINQSQTLSEEEVNEIVNGAITTAEERWQPIRRGKRRHA